MINKVLNVLESNFEWMKKDFILMISLIIASTIAMRVVNLHIIIQTIIICILVGKSFIFTNAYSIRPSIRHGDDQFSWKFIQGLPLNKKEIIISLVFSNLLSCIPLFLCMIFFWPQLNKNIVQTDFSFGKIFVNFVLFVILMDLSNLRSLIVFPRLEYQKRNSNHLLIFYLRNCLIYICAVVYFIVGTEAINKFFNIDIIATFGHLTTLLKQLALSWWLPPVLMILIVLMYNAILNVWTDEKKSYRSNVWNPKKEFSLILGSSALLFLVYTNLDWDTPDLYQGNLMKAVYQKNTNAIENELKYHPDINVKNELGMSAMLVAIKEGNVEMVKFLEKKGANFEGSLTNKKDSRYGFDALMLAIDSKNVKMLEYLASKNLKLNEYNKETGFYPIHLAVHYCNSPMVDFLLKNGSDVNALNSQGQSPLIISAKRDCFSNAVLLKEAGAKFDIADKEGKNVLSRLRDKKYNSEFQYFLEKNMRAPSSLESK